MGQFYSEVEIFNFTKSGILNMGASYWFLIVRIWPPPQRILLDRMAEGGVQSRYVKLTKDQGPLEDIKPGELNQSIDVPQIFLM
ncbi:hypothetical protein ACSBR1_027692 [Camellia fascicularis]